MKKILSVFLATIFVLSCIFPVFAADEELPAETVTAVFQSPSPEFDGHYFFVKSVNGQVQYVEDPDGIYVFYKGRYMTMDNIFPNYHHEVGPERYSPIEYDTNTIVNKGDTIIFKVITSQKYNSATVSVFVNGSRIEKNNLGEYTIYADRDLLINVAEYTAGGEPAILRNHYTVKLKSDEGYKVRTLQNQNYNVVYYGDSFDFRVQVAKGYSAAGMKVSVQRGNDGMSEYIGDDFDMLGEIMGKNETLTSYGVDSEGCRLYRIENITKDCKVIVSGVQEESKVGIMSMLKRILRLILNFLGIKADFLDNLVAYHTVELDTARISNTTVEVLRSSSDEITPTSFTVTNGEGVSLLITTTLDNPQDRVHVSWSPNNPTGTYQAHWVEEYDAFTGIRTYSAVYNIDNITEDTSIVVYTD